MIVLSDRRTQQPQPDVTMSLGTQPAFTIRIVPHGKGETLSADARHELSSHPPFAVLHEG